MKTINQKVRRQSQALTRAGKFICAALFLCAAPSLKATTYTVVDLGALANSNSSGGTTIATTTSYAAGINDAGKVVGTSNGGSYGQTAFVYNGSASLVNLGWLAGGNESVGFAINAYTMVVGRSGLSSPDYPRSDDAFIYESSTMNDLGELGDQSYYNPGNPYGSGYTSGAFGINAAGKVVGYSSTATYGYVACIFYQGLITPLGTLGGTSSYAFGINVNNEIVGYSNIAASTTYPYASYTHAFAYVSSMVDLGTLPGGTNSYAYAINDNNQIVGSSTTSATGSTNLVHAFLRNSGASMIDLGTLGGKTSEALAINKSGVIVGDSTLASGLTHAFVYTGDGKAGTKLTDLNTLVTGNNPFVELVKATGINASGEICGNGLLANGTQHAFLLKPVTTAAIVQP